MNTDSNVKVPSRFNGLAISQSSDRTTVAVPGVNKLLAHHWIRTLALNKTA